MDCNIKKFHWIYAIYASLLNTHCTPGRIPVAKLHYAALNKTTAILLEQKSEGLYITSFPLPPSVLLAF